jgi:hypothetical protein
MRLTLTLFFVSTALTAFGGRMPNPTRQHTPRAVANWSAWTAAKDDPHVQFRSTCSELSKDQAQWSIEIANGWPWSLALTAKGSNPSTKLRAKGSPLHRFFVSGLNAPLQVPPKGHLVLRFAEKDCKKQPKLTARMSIHRNDSYTYTSGYVYQNGRVDFTAGNDRPGSLVTTPEE